MKNGLSSKIKNLVKSINKKSSVPVVFLVLLLVGGGASALYLNSKNNPESLWSTALSRTADGLDRLIEQTTTGEQPKGVKIDGSFMVQSPFVADGSIEGSWYDSNASVSGDIGFSGVRATYDARVVTEEGSSAPDVYLKIDGLNGLDLLLGSSQPLISGIISEINGNWYRIDRSLLAQSLEQEDEGLPQVSAEDLNNIATKSAIVLRDRLFTTDEEKAIVSVEESLGDEEFEGEDTHKYRVRVNRQQLKDFLNEWIDVLDETKVAELFTQGVNSDKTFKEAIELDRLLGDLDNVDISDFKAEVWVNKDTKLIRNIRIMPDDVPEGSQQYLDIGLRFDGGDRLPFYIKLVTDSEATEDNLVSELKLTYKQDSRSVEIAFDIDGGDDIKANGSMSIKPSDEQVAPDVPEESKNVIELLGPLLGGLGGFGSGLGGDFDSFGIPGGIPGDFDIQSLPLDDVEL